MGTEGNRGTEDRIRLAGLLRQSSNTVFFGGAGVSTESGIPDFRSEAGLYAAREAYGHPPEVLLSHSLFMRDPELFFRYYKENLIARDALPNDAHKVLAEWEQEGALQAVITQNIDGLHQAAGSRKVLELHGSNWHQYCLGCGKAYPLDFILLQEGIPLCQACGGMVRPDVVLYEEGLDAQVMEASIRAIEEAQVLIVGGTSLAVYPAAGLLACFKGNALVLINKTPTPADRDADLVIHDSIGKVLRDTAALLASPDSMR
ncbi:MAG: NAD-dependent protein deacylase [Coriobacteriaceae bacterium]|jgi:NAD-dependent deacetylase|nr:NAD-dependent protein deacylase [Coriobacteriaceae bacterium]